MDGFQVRLVMGKGDDGKLGCQVEPFDVDDVEAGKRDAVQHYQAQLLTVRRTVNHRGKLVGRVEAVDFNVGVHDAVDLAAPSENDAHNDHGTRRVRDKFAVVDAEDADFRLYDSKLFGLQNASLKNSRHVSAFKTEGQI